MCMPFSNDFKNRKKLSKN